MLSQVRQEGKQEGKLEGKQESLFTLLENFGQALLPAFRQKIQDAKTVEECNRLEREIYADIRRL